MGRGAVEFDGSNLLVVIGGQATERHLRQQRHYEELIATCMADEGFEYVADDMSELADHIAKHEELEALSPEEYTEQYGYGISTVSAETIEVVEGPNDAILAAMSAEGVAEWERALYGDEHGGGCTDEAAEQLDEDETVDAMAEFDGLTEDLQVLRQRLRDHPKVVEARQRWSECMADAGYPGFDDLDGPQVEVGDRLLVLEGWEGDGDRLGAFEGDLPEIDQDELLKLQTYELAVAAADLGCRHEYIHDIARDVQNELEAEFVAEHRDELERYRDFISTELEDSE